MGFMDKMRSRMGGRGGAMSKMFGKRFGGQGEGGGGDTPVMAKPGKGSFGGGFGGLFGKMGNMGGLKAQFDKMKFGKFGRGEGGMPQGAGPEEGGPQQIGKFGGGPSPMKSPGMSRGLGGKLRGLMQRRRRPIGGGPGRPGGPPDPRMKKPMGGMY